MWQTSALFENVGTIQDGMQTMGRPYSIFKINQMQQNLDVPQGEIKFENVQFCLQR